jgi:adenylate kinase
VAGGLRVTQLSSRQYASLSEKEMVKRLIFLGPPGAGKGTQAQRFGGTIGKFRISQRGIFCVQAMSDWETPLGQKAQGLYVDGGELVPDELMLGLIRERLCSTGCGVGLDFRRVSAQCWPSGIPGCGYWVEFQQQSPDRVLSLEAFPRRCWLSSPARVGAVKDDSEETVRRRLEVYQQQTAPGE